MTFEEIIKEAEKQKHKFIRALDFEPEFLNVSRDVYEVFMQEVIRKGYSRDMVTSTEMLDGLIISIAITDRNKYIKVS